MGVVYDWDLKTNEVYQSEDLAIVVGYRPGEEPEGEGRWWPRNIHPEDFKRMDAGLHEALASQKNSFAYEYRIRHANAHWVTIWDQCCIVRDALSRQCGWLAYVQISPNANWPKKSCANAK